MTRSRFASLDKAGEWKGKQSNRLNISDLASGFAKVVLQQCQASWLVRQYNFAQIWGGENYRIETQVR